MKKHAKKWLPRRFPGGPRRFPGGPRRSPEVPRRSPEVSRKMMKIVEIYGFGGRLDVFNISVAPIWQRVVLLWINRICCLKFVVFSMFILLHALTRIFPFACRIFQGNRDELQFRRGDKTKMHIYSILAYWRRKPLYLHDFGVLAIAPMFFIS
jgi:hypothetical protein